ncbi:uncharacterized protein [Aristolochia californica]|uniref:uncharacterized protein n=1 Tax=Aristolochia californica TaxID=171875 RepID=UPI0035DE275F
MVENKSEDDELASALGAAEVLIQISAGRSYRPMLPPPPRRWGQRLPRSRQITGAGILQAKLEEPETRGSPNSTLLWNCATSPSDDCVEVCETANTHPAKTKTEDVAAKELPCMLPSTSTSSCRRVKRKKTVEELREEESSLRSENMNLKKEIENMQRCLGELRTGNNGLKLKLQMEEKRTKVEYESDVMEPRSKGFLLPDLNEPFEVEVVCVAEQ